MTQLYIKRQQELAITSAEEGHPMFLVSTDPEFAGAKTEGFALQDEKEAELLKMLIFCINRILTR